MITNFQDFINEKVQNLELWVGLYEEGTFLGVFDSKEKMTKAKDDFYDLKQPKNNPFFVKDIKRQEVFLIFDKEGNIYYISPEEKPAKILYKQEKLDGYYKVKINEKPRILKIIK
jgi:hypothetical protein